MSDGPWRFACGDVSDMYLCVNVNDVRVNYLVNLSYNLVNLSYNLVNLSYKLSGDKNYNGKHVSDMCLCVNVNDVRVNNQRAILWKQRGW